MKYILKIVIRSCGKCFNERQEVWILQEQKKKPDIQIEMLGYICDCGSKKIPSSLKEYTQPTMAMNI